jgi:FkbM family methyltransferase
MKQMEFWPAYTKPNEIPYTANHVKVIELALDHCQRFRTAVQAGGSIGYWPRRMSECFARVITFEPETLIRECLVKNLSTHPNIEVRSEALGDHEGRCGLQLNGFGSHRIVDGDSIPMISIDSLGLNDLDFIQLDIEGYEIHALTGAIRTIADCRPLVQVEILRSGDDIFNFLGSMDYKMIGKTARDYVFKS